MYNNISGKLKTAAVIMAIVLTIGYIVIGAVMIDAGSGLYGGNSLVTYGFICIIVGPLLAWLTSLMIYGFGELIEKVQGIHETVTQKNKVNWTNPTSFQPRQGSGTNPINDDSFQPKHGVDFRQRQTWICQSCGLENDFSSPYCERCGRR